MTSATEQTDRHFLSAALSDEDRGYPSGTSFVSHDLPKWEQIALRNLRQGQPTVVVNGQGVEYLLVPRLRAGVRRWADLVFRRNWAEIYWRHGDHTHGGIAVNVSRDTLERLDRDPQLAPG
jgi:hypothetical protein